jgi:ferredoxin-like protein FixX
MKIARLINIFPHDYSDLHPFVFAHSGEPPIDTHGQTTDILACPFRTFSIEVDNGMVTSDADSLGCNISTIFCHEITCDQYEFIALVEMARKNEFVFHATRSGVDCYENGKLVKQHEGDSIYESFKVIVDNFLKRLHSEKKGKFNTGAKAKFKASTGIKKTYKGKGVIYVSNNPDKPRAKGTLAQNIEWLGSWDVMEHWRKIKPESMGLDRDGNRTVLGRTFIKTYSKGEGEKIIKTRKVTK